MRRAALASVLLAASWAAWAQEPPAPIVFVQAADLRLFEDPSGPLAPEVRAVQERLNQRALEQLLASLESLPDSTARPAFLVLTGSLGVDPCGTEEGQSDALCSPPPAAGADSGTTAASPTWHRRTEQVARLATLFAASPLRDIYLVPGPRDIPRQLPTAEALGPYHQLLDDVQAELKKRASAVVLHPLTSCYLEPSAPLTGCYADVDPGLRLVGFPAWSFANPDTARQAENQALQETQMATFGRLLAATAAAGKKVVVLSPSAELDDPLLQAEARFRRDASQEPWPAWSAWKVSDSVRDAWRTAIDGPEVAGVLAGGFHDDHPEIYRPPYPWATASSQRPDPARLLLAPPLAVSQQDRSPLQARGFALLRFAGGRLSRQLFWYDDIRGRFAPEPVAAPPSAPAWTPPALVTRLWRLPGSTNDLERAAVLAIAFLAAFLTVVQIWRVPPAGTAGTTAEPAKDEKQGVAWLFQGNFGRTVLSGLGGMLAVSFLNPFWSSAKINALAYYLVTFVLFFICLLVASAFFRAINEALRNHLMTASRRWQMMPADGRFLTYLRRWLGPYLTTLHVFMDTFFNYLQGKNQFHTELFEEESRRSQAANLGAVQRLARGIDQTVTHVLQQKLSNERLRDTDVRVAVSLLSNDEQFDYYLTAETGSLPRPFSSKSFAWLTAYTGQALWWKHEPGEAMVYHPDLELLDPESLEDLPLLKRKKIRLKDYLEARGGDYAAFLLLPLPWSRRGLRGYSKGVLHISFKKAEWLDLLWDGLEASDANSSSRRPKYARWTDLLEKAPAAQSSEASKTSAQKPARQEHHQESMEQAIHIRSEELRLVLEQAVEVLGELLRGFNQKLFESRQGLTGEPQDPV